MHLEHRALGDGGSNRLHALFCLGDQTARYGLATDIVLAPEAIAELDIERIMPMPR